jgi:hypothetical protein
MGGMSRRSPRLGDLALGEQVPGDLLAPGNGTRVLCQPSGVYLADVGRPGAVSCGGAGCRAQGGAEGGQGVQGRTRTRRCTR